jgi:hypothetical protein
MTATRAPEDDPPLFCGKCGRRLVATQEVDVVSTAIEPIRHDWLVCPLAMTRLGVNHDTWLLSKRENVWVAL